MFNPINPFQSINPQTIFLICISDYAFCIANRYTITYNSIKIWKGDIIMATKRANVLAHIEPVVTLDTMSDTKFDSVMEKGLQQAQADQSRLYTDVFKDLRQEIHNNE